MEWAVIDTARTWDELRTKEREYIALHRSRERGDNSTAGGENNGLILEQRCEGDAVYTKYSPSDAGRYEGQNTKVEVLPDTHGKAPNADGFKRAEASAEQRLEHRAQRKEWRAERKAEQALPEEERKIAKAARKARNKARKAEKYNYYGPRVTTWNRTG
jgi:hypothetical protein